MVVSATPFVPYYLSWDPTGTRVALPRLRRRSQLPGRDGRPGGRARVDRAEAGRRWSPFLYFAWGPDGSTVLAHAGYERLEEIRLNGRSTSVTPRPGLFATPAWSADGRTLVYVERGAGNVQRLIARAGDGGKPRTLVEGRGAVSFVLRPDGAAVAYQVLGPGEGDFFDRRPSEPGDGVRVVDLRTGGHAPGHPDQSDDVLVEPGRRAPPDVRPATRGPGHHPFGWQVWDGRTTSDVQGLHSPTLSVLQDYAPFFTQYAQSSTPWAPDGSAFAFAAESPDGTGRIVVQEVDGEPIVVGEGMYVTWSPTEA